MKFGKMRFTATLCVALSSISLAQAGSGNGEVTFIHMGDLHGHLIPHPNVRSDGNGQSEGGLARIYSLVREIRQAKPRQTLLVNTGDTLHGGAEALFTQGEAMIKVLNAFRIDAYAPGNWDYVYGADKFIDYFADSKPKANWHAVISNLYYDNYPGAEARTGQHVAPPYMIKTINGLRVGILGFTSDRGPQAGDPNITKGLKFTNGEAEYEKYAKLLREQEKVDLVVAISELGLHGNLTLADRIPGVDVILSSDKHEITPKPIVSRHGTLIVEQGMDGQVVGELTVRVKNGKVVDKKYVSHRITNRLKENPAVAALIKSVRRPYVAGPQFRPGQFRNPISGAPLRYPIDSVIGQTQVALYRSNFSDEAMPGVIEGSSHDFLTDAFRVMTGAQLGGITGFRYGTTVAPGPIKLEDLYHYMPIGPQIAKGELTGAQIKKTLEGNPQGEQGRVNEWINGWTAGYSGLTADFDPLAPQGERVRNIQVNGQPLDLNASYTVAGFYFDLIPGQINRVPAKNVTVLKDKDGSLLDGTDVVKRYIESLPASTVTADNLRLNRIRLVNPLPKPEHGIREIQPLGSVAK
ncbi:bifunctional UDP-sugar hydrolase/5'-nucleotidase [Thermithiobacillus plumbiphilus]|uniref:Bifunctional UDP-sugar hydrolase/5'-nucleotidase n=1 Tax=Thermithiobacillus plumbiphilus TaxID=1729899 RepID=A0ABU9D9U9_9PROT